MQLLCYPVVRQNGQARYKAGTPVPSQQPRFICLQVGRRAEDTMRSRRRYGVLSHRYRRFGAVIHEPLANKQQKKQSKAFDMNNHDAVPIPVSAPLGHAGAYALNATEGG